MKSAPSPPCCWLWVENVGVCKAIGKVCLNLKNVSVVVGTAVMLPNERNSHYHGATPRCAAPPGASLPPPAVQGRPLSLASGAGSLVTHFAYCSTPADSNRLKQTPEQAPAFCRFCFIIWPALPGLHEISCSSAYRAPWTESRRIRCIRDSSSSSSWGQLVGGASVTLRCLLPGLVHAAARPAWRSTSSK